MFQNYLITAWRNLWKNKVFSAINIFGLSVGMAAFLLIANYLRFEYSYDDFQENKDRLFRVPMKIAEKDGKLQTFAFTYPAVAPAMKKDFPEIQETVRFRRQGGVITAGEVKLVEQGAIYYVDASIFKLFTLPFKEGNAPSAFINLNDAVITESTEKKYFGNTSAIGKPLRYNNEDYIVKAVLKDLPTASHLQFSILFNYLKYVQIAKNFGGDAEGSWGWSDYYTYLLLKPEASAKQLESKFPAFANRYLGTDMKEKGYTITFDLQSIKDIHLRSAYDYELAGNGNFSYLKYLAIAALVILVIAWINYINLSTAKSFDRSKEVGLRKVIGAGRSQLIWQFLTESLIVNTIAVVSGVILMKLTLPAFSALVEKDVTDLSASGRQFWLFILTVCMLGSLLAGFYPAFILSSFKPIQALKSSAGNFNSNNRNYLRRILVVVQFSAAIVLIAGAIGFYTQLRFMSGKDLGVDINETIVIQQTTNQDSSRLSSVESFINEVEANPAVKVVTGSTSVPGEEVGGSSNFNLLHSTSEKRCRIFGVDNKYIPAYGLTLLAGRNFTTDLPATDTGRLLNIIINETAARIFGLADVKAAIGQRVEGAGYHCQIIGVVKDYHQESLKETFDPIVFYPDLSINLFNYSVKYKTAQVDALVDFLKQKWNSRFPESPFFFSFLDDRFNAQYKNDRLFAIVVSLFTAMAIIIACLGLFGLSLYTIAKRSKEISIRKVLGATVVQIATLVTKDYMRLILFAALVAVPVAYWLLLNWLQQYAFHISIGWWFFLIPLVLIAGIALLTVL
ncbi:MAG TPA: ABC transporter permease, partial [Flavitalea sp.]|nr:ABC transporter permease [Flavitalea sp.]